MSFCSTIYGNLPDSGFVYTATTVSVSNGSFDNLSVVNATIVNLVSAPMNMTKKLKKAKYVLNIPYHTHNILETHRINKALSCGCDVVSLYSGDKITDDFYEDYVYMTHDIVEVFNEDLTGNKKPYHELSKFLTQKLTTHNNWYISKIFENLS